MRDWFDLDGRVAVVTGAGGAMGSVIAVGLAAYGADNLDVSVSQVMSAPVALAGGDSVGTAIAKMSSGGYRRLPILDDQGRPTGLVKDAGILHYLVEHFPKVVYTLPPTPNPTTKQREGA